MASWTVFTTETPEFKEKFSETINSDNEYSAILSKMTELAEKKKELIKKNKEILRLLRDMDEELEELECKRYSRKIEVGSKLFKELNQ